MDVTTLVTTLFAVNITVTLGVALLLWRGLSSRVDDLKDLLSARIDGQSDRIDDRFDGLSARVDGLSARLDDLSTRVDNLTTRVDGLTMTVGRMEGWLERDRAEKRISETAS